MKKYGWIAVMQPDGNFVEYNGAMAPLWSTNTFGNPNSTIAIQDDGNLVVYSPTKGAIWSIGTDANYGNPTKIGDVLGRDLNVPGMSWAGHLGIWQGQNVVDVRPPATSGGNAVYLTTVEAFKTASNYWGVASADIPFGYIREYCYKPYCNWSENISVTARDSIGRSAYLAYLIGADYTVSSTFLGTFSATPEQPAQRGVFRCDTFIIHALARSTVYTTATAEQNRWITQYNNIRLGTITPPTVFDKLKAAH
jgi:hypothetical protein